MPRQAPGSGVQGVEGAAETNVNCCRTFLFECHVHSVNLVKEHNSNKLLPRDAHLTRRGAAVWQRRLPPPQPVREVGRVTGPHFLYSDTCCSVSPMAERGQDAFVSF